MSSHAATPPQLKLSRISDLKHHPFVVPSKKINDGDDLEFFFTSAAYNDLKKWIIQLTRHMFPSQSSGAIHIVKLDRPTSNAGPYVHCLQLLLQSCSKIIESAPPDQGEMRFGNIAYRKWYDLVEVKASEFLTDFLGDTGGNHQHELVEELKAYFLGGFPSSSRLDYGTGHEMSFLAFLGCLWKIGIFADGEEPDIVIGVIQP